MRTRAADLLDHARTTPDRPQTTHGPPKLAERKRRLSSVLVIFDSNVLGAVRRCAALADLRPPAEDRIEKADRAAENQTGSTDRGSRTSHFITCDRADAVGSKRVWR